MSNTTDHSYQGRQSALQVFKEFSGANSNQDEEDMEVETNDEEETSAGEAEPHLSETTPSSRPRVLSDEYHFERQSSWKKFKKSVKDTLAGWKGGGSSTTSQQSTVEISQVIENDTSRKIKIDEDPPIRPDVPQRSKSVKIERNKDGLRPDRKLRSSLKEPRSTDVVPQIIITKEDGRLSTPSPKVRPKKDSFCASLPDVTAIGDDTTTTGSSGAAMTELSNKQIRIAIIEAARSKTRQRSVHFESEEDGDQGSELDETTTTTTTPSAAATTTTTTPPRAATATTTRDNVRTVAMSSSVTSSVVKTSSSLTVIKKETISVSNPDVSQTTHAPVSADHEGTKLAVMKIRAAIANLSVNPGSDTGLPAFPPTPDDVILSRRRLSSEETKSGATQPERESSVSQRSSSVDFTASPKQRRELMTAAANAAGEGNPDAGGQHRRVGSVKRSDSLKRSESLKKKQKARPMIWDHFDDVPHTSLQGRCKVCHMTVSCKFNTGHFVRHLQLAHRDVYLSYQNKMQSNWTRSQLARSLK